VWSSSTYTLDGTAWTKRVLGIGTAAPSPRAYVSLSYDANRKVVVLFGGSDKDTAYDETWEWNGSAWKNIGPDTAPDPREGAASVYDVKRLQTVMFGGLNQRRHLHQRDLTWNGTAWTQGHLTTTRPAAPTSAWSTTRCASGP